MNTSTLLVKICPLFLFVMPVRAADPVLRADIGVELFNCRLDAGKSSVCSSSGNHLGGVKSVEVHGDSGNAEYIVFVVSGDKTARVKLGTNSSADGRYFLTTSINAFDTKFLKSLFQSADTITEVSAKNAIKSFQIYSPEFKIDGLTKSLKATITIK